MMVDSRDNDADNNYDYNDDYNDASLRSTGVSS